MFKKKAKTPDVKEKEVGNLPALPNGQKTPPFEIITKDSTLTSSEPPPEIKSVGVSIQPPAVKPQQAELHQPHFSHEIDAIADEGVIENNDDAFGDFQSHESTMDPSSSTPIPPRSRTKTEGNNGELKPKTLLNKQLSAIHEVPSSDERTRPTTALIAPNIRHDDTVKEEGQGGLDGLDGLSSNGSIINKSPPIQKKVPTRKKGIQNDSPPAARKNGETVTIKKSKLKPVDNVKIETVKTTISKPPATAGKPAVKKQKVVIDEPENLDTQDFAMSSEDFVEHQSLSKESGVKSLYDKLDDFGNFNVKNDEEEEIRIIRGKSKSPDRGRTASRKRVESEKLTKAKKALTPKPASKSGTARRSSSRGEKLQRRRQFEVGADGFNAMGLAENDDLTTSHASKSDAPKRVLNQPAPPPHYLLPTAAISTSKRSDHSTSKGQSDLVRNPSSRRKAIKSLAHNSMGSYDDDPDEPRTVSRFGHYDFDDRRSKSMQPTEYRNSISRQRMASDYANGRNRTNNDFDYDETIELDKGTEFYREENEEENSNSSQEYRYSDRISGKYKNVRTSKLKGGLSESIERIPDRLMLSSSALKAAADQGMVSPETINYLKWYMVKAKPLEPTPAGSLTDNRINSNPNLTNSEAKLDKKRTYGDGLKAGRPSLSNKVIVPLKVIMDDDPSDYRSRNSISKKQSVPMKSSRSIMDDNATNIGEQETPPPKPRPIPKTRVTIVSKPKPTAPKKNAQLSKQDESVSPPQHSFWGGQQSSPFMPFGQHPYQMHPQMMHPFGGSIFQQQAGPNLPPYNSVLRSQAPLPSLNPHAKNHPPQYQPPAPTVHPGLMPARIKLTTVPVVTFKQSYVIEPTGHPPGTYIPPEEMGMDPATGSMLTYISTAPPGSFPSLFDVGGNDPYGQENSRPVEGKRPLAGVKGGGTGAKNGKPGVRSMIQKGMIGRGK